MGPLADRNTHARASPRRRSRKHAHGHAAGSHQLDLDHGTKRSTVAPLRQGMSAIRDAVSAGHDAIHRKQATSANYRALAKKVDERVAYMVANCKLPPDADENLHVILAGIIAGSDLMKGAGKVKARKGAINIIGAVETYPKYFDHPDWRPLQ